MNCISVLRTIPWLLVHAGLTKTPTGHCEESSKDLSHHRTRVLGMGSGFVVPFVQIKKPSLREKNLLA